MEVTEAYTRSTDLTKRRRMDPVLVGLRRGLVFLAAMCCVLLLLLWYVGVFGGNLHAVQPEKVYRSAQLTGNTLKHALKADKIHTVLNLRGAEKDSAWYQDETRICRDLGVDHVDVAFSATHLPPPDQLSKMVRTMDSARYPLLLHCMGGSDRTGLAATIYMVLHQHQTLDQAENAQLTLRYGHVRWSRSGAMDHFFNLYRRNSGGLSLRDWIFRKYPDIYHQTKP